VIDLGPRLRLPDHEVEFDAVRAQGPGGQNVNKVATAIVLRFDIRRSSLPQRYKDGLLALSDRRISAAGVLTLKAQRHRSQERNRDDALARLRDLVSRAGERDKPRVATRPSAAAKTRRIEAKKRRAGLKSLRRVPAEDA
jgi:ribosome-associated protein